MYLLPPRLPAGLLAPSRTSILRQASSPSDWLQAATFCQGRVDRRPRPLEAGGLDLQIDVSPCSTAPPTGSALPRPPADDETNRGAPSHRHRQSSDAAAWYHCSPTSPRRPTGDACGSLFTACGTPASVETGLILGPFFGQVQPACPQGYDLCWTHSPSKWPLDSYRLCPDGHTTAGPPPPTPDQTWQTPRDQIPTHHRLVPSAS